MKTGIKELTKKIASYNRMAGLSLIEMMAVMVVLAVTVSIILPNFEKWFESTSDQVEKTRIAAAFQKIFIRAALLEQDIEIDHENYHKLLADGAPAIDLPDGWNLPEGQKLKVWRSGVCEESKIFLISGKKKIGLKVEKDSCSVSILR